MDKKYPRCYMQMPLCHYLAIMGCPKHDKNHQWGDDGLTVLWLLFDPSVGVDLKRSHSGEVESDSASKCFQSKIQISPSLARLKWFASYEHNSTVMYGTYTIWFWISANCMQMFAKQVVLLLVEQCQLTRSANMLESNSGKLIKF